MPFHTSNLCTALACDSSLVPIHGNEDHRVQHKVSSETNVSESSSRIIFVQIMSDWHIPIGRVLVMSPNERFVLILLFSLFLEDYNTIEYSTPRMRVKGHSHCVFVGLEHSFSCLLRPEFSLFRPRLSDLLTTHHSGFDGCCCQQFY